MSTKPKSKGKTEFRIGSRKSNLALIQTRQVQKMLQERFPEYTFPISTMETLGDAIQTKPLHEIGAKALWTRELEEALVADQIDLIVHSLKDMPTELPEYAVLGAVLEREDARDAVVMKSGSAYKTIQELPAKSVVATSSVRRAAQLKRAFPHLQFADMRGNVETRLSKLDNPQNNISCLILAAAGLLRLGRDERITQTLSSPVLYGAVGQGALGIEIRKNDKATFALVDTLTHRNTYLACIAERNLLRILEGGCSVPIGVESAVLPDGNLRLEATVVALDGTAAVIATLQSRVSDISTATELGRGVADELVALGADRILAAIRSHVS